MTRRAGVYSFSNSNSRAVVILAQTGAILFSGKNLLLLKKLIVSINEIAFWYFGVV